MARSVPVSEGSFRMMKTGLVNDLKHALSLACCISSVRCDGSSLVEDIENALFDARKLRFNKKRK